jgi:hypothetical protein
MTTLRVLVACEYSGVVRRAFLARGCDAWSCDLLPSEDGSNRHIRGDARDLLHDGWDLLMVAHPPCTRLCNSGVRWLHAPPPGKTAEQMARELREGAALFGAFWNAPIPRVAIENPVMHGHAKRLIQNYAEPAFGCVAFRRCGRRRSSAVVKRACIACRRARRAGRSGRAFIPASLRRWPSNGPSMRGGQRHDRRRPSSPPRASRVPR